MITKIVPPEVSRILSEDMYTMEDNLKILTRSFVLITEHYIYKILNSYVILYKWNFILSFNINEYKWIILQRQYSRS